MDPGINWVLPILLRVTEAYLAKEQGAEIGQRKLAGVVGIELTTFGFGDRRSNQLS
jgi:hypothetical protein